MFRTIALVCFSLLLYSPLEVRAQSFEDALKSAYLNNSTLNAERENMASIDERVPQAFSGFMPSATYNYTKAKDTTKYGSRAEDTTYPKTNGVTITQPIFNGGSTVARVQSARNQVKSAREGLRNTEQNTLLDAVTAYMDVVRDQAIVELTKSNLDVLKKRLDMTQERFDVGELTKTDVAQANARYSSSVAENIRAQGNLESSKAFFEKVIKMPAGQLKKPTTLPIVPSVFDEIINIAYDNNPQFKASFYLQKSADKDIYANAAELLPDVRVVARKSDQDGLNSFRGGSIDEESVTLDVSIPLYQSGAEYSRIRQAKRTAERRKYERDASIDQIRQTVTQSWERLNTAKASIKSIKEAIAAAEMALEGVKLEAEFGTRTTLDILDAQQELFRTQVELVRAEREEIVALFALKSAMGELSMDKLGISVDIYDPKENYNKVKYQMIGL